MAFVGCFGNFIPFEVTVVSAKLDKYDVIVLRWFSGNGTANTLKRLERGHTKTCVIGHG